MRLRIKNRDYDFPLGLFNLQDIRREMVERILANPPPGITITP